MQNRSKSGELLTWQSRAKPGCNVPVWGKPGTDGTFSGFYVSEDRVARTCVFCRSAALPMFPREEPQTSESTRSALPASSWVFGLPFVGPSDVACGVPVSPRTPPFPAGVRCGCSAELPGAVARTCFLGLRFFRLLQRPRGKSRRPKKQVCPTNWPRTRVGAKSAFPAKQVARSAGPPRCWSPPNPDPIRLYNN
jgi:hypothetical protein